MVVSEKSATGGEVDEETVYFSVDLKNVINFHSDEFNKKGKLILERASQVYVGDTVLILKGHIFELVRINADHKLNCVLDDDEELIGKLKILEIKLL